MQLTMTMKIVCSLVLLALVRGQENTCCPPPQWEASIKAHGVAFSPLGTDVYTTTQKVVLDEIRGRFAHMVNATFELRGPYNYFALEDYRTNKRYLVVNGECTVSRLSGDFNREWCVSPARFQRNMTFGLGDQSFVLQSFAVSRDLPTYDLVGQSLVTRLSANRCAVHQEMIDLISKDDPPSRSIRVSFVVHDMKDTISDGSIFDIPKSCRGQRRQKRSAESDDVEEALGIRIYP